LRNRKLKINPIVPVFFLTFCFFACSTRPSYVLSESKMEKVLYDIYLAEAEISNHYAVFSSDSARKQELFKSVLKKHKITEAVLDTSLAWYSGHLEKYFQINEKVSKRFTETAEKLRKLQQEETTAKSNVNTDYLILPVEKERVLLQSIDLPNNVYTFKADTALSRYGGNYELQFDIRGLSGSLHPVVTLCIRCSDTIFVKRDTIRQNGLFLSSVDIRPAKQAKELYGSIYFPEIYPETTVFIQNFMLTHSFRPRAGRDLGKQSLNRISDDSHP